MIPVVVDLPTLQMTCNQDPRGEFCTGHVHLNIAQLALTSEYFRNYANMYDQVKIHSVNVSMMPLTSMASKV